MEKKRLAYLLEQFLQGRASAGEREELHVWFRSFDHGEVEWPAHNAEEENEVMDRLFQQITLRTQPVATVKKIRPFRIAIIAASMLFVCSVGVYLFMQSRNGAALDDVTPGYNRATITLADGTTVSLDTAQSGIVVKDGSITYNNGETIHGIGGHTEYSVLTIPKGGQYKVVLSDGSSVWLNSNSTLKYPLTFSKASREVELTGEAYFQVESKPEEGYTPFIVKTAGQKVTVLGTEFNIAAYEDETDTKTTLVEGKVWVSAMAPADQTVAGGERNGSDTEITLKPGQQAVLTGSTLRAFQADIAATTAWKNGLFDFTGKDLKEVMRELARWYDIEVEFEGSLPEDKFYGKIYRNSNLSLVLNMLEITDVQYRLEGKKLIINFT